MTLELQISPAEEQELQVRAEREGLSPLQLAHQIVSTALRPQKSYEEMQAEMAAAFAASGETEEEMEEFVQRVVKEVRAEMSARERGE